MSTPVYPGGELELFALAANWKLYLRKQISPYLGTKVLEAGAGVGGTTAFLCPGDGYGWTCLEPDGAMAASLKEKVGAGELPARCAVVQGTVADIPSVPSFDTVLYIDVLEHVKDDAAELASAARLLKPGGRLIVLAPAHQFLFSEFDGSIGHFRRYSRGSLAAAAPPGLRTLRLSYLDSAGLLASLGNRLMLRQAVPTRRQIKFWDGVLVPVSCRMDPVLGYRLGKSVLGVWEAD